MSGALPAALLTHGGADVSSSTADDDGGGWALVAAGGGGGTTARPAKRRRCLAPLDWLLEQCTTHRAKWCPVLAALMHHHGYQLAPAFHDAVLRLLAPAVSVLLPTGTAQVPAAAGRQSGYGGAGGVGGCGGGLRASPIEEASRAGVGLASGAAAAALMGSPKEAAARHVALMWVLRCVEVVAQQRVYAVHPWPAGSRFFGCPFAATTGPSMSAAAHPAVANGGAGDMDGTVALAAAAWQRVTGDLAAAVQMAAAAGGPAALNLMVPPTPGLPPTLLAEALHALDAVLQLRAERQGAAAPGMAAAGGLVCGTAAVNGSPMGAMVQPGGGLLHSLLAVMQTCAPPEATASAVNSPDGELQGGAAMTATAASVLMSRTMTWRVAATAVTSFLAAHPPADSATAAASRAAAANALAAAQRLSAPPPGQLVHALLAAASGSDLPYAAESSHWWRRGRAPQPPTASDTAREPPPFRAVPLPALPMDLDPAAYPHPLTRLPRWCAPDDPEAGAWCTALFVQRRAVDVMAWQEARERAARHIADPGVGGGSMVSAADGSSSGGGGSWREMGALAAQAAQRLRSLMLQASQADAEGGAGGGIGAGGGGGAGGVVGGLLPRMLGCAHVLLAAVLHAHALRTPAYDSAATDGGAGSPPLPYTWVTAGQAWAKLARVAVTAARATVGSGGGGGGMAAARAAAVGGDEELLPELLQLLKGMVVGLARAVAASIGEPQSLPLSACVQCSAQQYCFIVGMTLSLCACLSSGVKLGLRLLLSHAALCPQGLRSLLALPWSDTAPGTSAAVASPSPSPAPSSIPAAGDVGAELSASVAAAEAALVRHIALLQRVPEVQVCVKTPTAFPCIEVIFLTSNLVRHRNAYVLLHAA